MYKIALVLALAVFGASARQLQLTPRQGGKITLFYHFLLKTFV